ncbi:hypothetical protein [Sphingomonas sp. RIT328]|uniref:hypothetical protein n=1 Tax=Sphingomonas sp. RIT328 TaxID=1470591 RepID=UPI0004463618|nr:hypothetical protein [Sphingomonas sp. RIT328]EZP57461.1 hypothetical protein BW41_00306 [Sphingomonas sp. RIT328]
MTSSQTQIEARCVAIADTVVPNYRNGKRASSCTSQAARMWQAAYDGAANVLSGSHGVPTPAVLSDARVQCQAFWDAAQECLRVGEETEFAADVTQEHRNGYKAACNMMSAILQKTSHRVFHGLPWNDTPPASDAAVPAGLLREALQRARETLEVYADPTGYTDNEGEQLTAEDELHPGLLAQHTLEQIAAMLAAAPKVASDTGAGVDTLAKHVAEVMAEDGGCWTACSGCQESDEGYVSEKYYPYSPIFRCQPGGGCSECGGIGVIWNDGAFLASWGDSLATPTDATDGATGGGEVT